MSEEQLKAFLAKVKADTSLPEKLKAEGADVVAIAKAAGFAISTEDLNNHRQQPQLSDNELEGAAGGCVLVATKETPDISHDWDKMCVTALVFTVPNLCC